MTTTIIVIIAASVGAAFGFILQAMLSAAAIGDLLEGGELNTNLPSHPSPPPPPPRPVRPSLQIFSHHDLIPPDGVSMTINPLTVIQEDDEVLMVTISTDVRWIHPGDYVLLDTRGEGRLSILTSLQFESLFNHNPTSW